MPLGTSICLCLFSISFALSLCALFFYIPGILLPVMGENVILVIKKLAPRHLSCTVSGSSN